MNKKLLLTTGLVLFLITGAFDRVAGQSSTAIDMNNGDQTLEECLENANLGGPNGVDDCTVLYMKFDNGDLTNVATETDNGVAHGNVQYFDVSVNGDLGKSLYLNNEAVTDSAYVTVADNDALDLVGNWTIESWFFLNSYGESNEDHRFAPTVIWKPGNPFYLGNYFIETFGSTRFLSTGYRADTETGGWPTVNTDDNAIEPQKWYHVALVRDTTYHVVLQLLHDEDLNLLFSKWSEYDTTDQATPQTTDRPVHIGFNGGDQVQPSFFDGFIDELRISNVVRNYEIAPLIVEVDEIPNLGADATVVPPLTARIGSIGSSAFSDAELHYKIGDSWKSVAMSQVEGDQYEGNITENDVSGSVLYYISATNEAGQTSYYPQDAGAETNPEYLSFSVVSENSRILGLSFEEGNGNAPIDSSIFDHPINVEGARAYSEDAVEGNLSYQFSTDSEDYLEFNSSVVGNTEEFTIDFWYQMTDEYVASYDNGDFWKFVTNKGAIEGCAGCWGENTFEVILGAFDAAEPRLTAGKWSDGEQSRITIDSVLTPGEWYHVQYEVRVAPEGDANNYYLLFQLSDSEDNKIQSKFIGFQQAPAVAGNPVRIGSANQGRNGSSTVNALIDNYQSFNYATNEISIDAPPSIAGESLGNQPSGSDDYPVEVSVSAGLGVDIDAVNLLYRVDGGEWQTIAMTNTEGIKYSASIPNQADYSIVDYYIEATNVDDLTSYMPAGAEVGVYNSFVVEVPDSEVLSLDFEGTGVPVDGSNYDSKVEFQGGEPTFGDGFDGQSILLDGVDDYLQVYNPAIAGGEEFAVDFKFNANSYDKFWSFIMNQPSLGEAGWGENAFEVLYGAFDDAEWKITAGIWNPEDGSKRLTLSHLLETETWYQVKLQVEKAPVDSSFNYIMGIELYDASGSKLDQGTTTFNNPVVRSSEPMVIGKAGGVDGFPDFFDGDIDDVKIYNYAAFDQFVTPIEKDIDDGVLPQKFELAQNYPNPFNPTTRIPYSLSTQSDVRLEVFNILGQKVATLVDAAQTAGRYTATFDASSLSSGMYFYRLEAGSYVQVQKMILIK